MPSIADVCSTFFLPISSVVINFCSFFLSFSLSVRFSFTADKEYLRFQGNESTSDYFKLVLRDPNTNNLLVGAR